jgi:hypothetical protein
LPPGDERFHEVIAQNATKSCIDLGRSIVEQMIQWSGNPAGFADDVTLVVIDVQ